MNKEVPHKKYSDLKKELPSMERFMMYAVGFMMMFLFVVTFISNPVTTGLSVVEPEQEAARFTGSSVILLIIFAFFGLFIFMVTRKMRER